VGDKGDECLRFRFKNVFKESLRADHMLVGRFITIGAPQHIFVTESGLEFVVRIGSLDPLAVSPPIVSVIRQPPPEELLDRRPERLSVSFHHVLEDEFGRREASC